MTRPFKGCVWVLPWASGTSPGPCWAVMEQFAFCKPRAWGAGRMEGSITAGTCGVLSAPPRARNSFSGISKHREKQPLPMNSCRICETKQPFLTEFWKWDPWRGMSQDLGRAGYGHHRWWHRPCIYCPWTLMMPDRRWCLKVRWFWLFKDMFWTGLVRFRTAANVSPLRRAGCGQRMTQRSFCRIRSSLWCFFHVCSNFFS